MYSISGWSILAFGWMGPFNFLFFTGFQGLLGSEPNFYPQLCSPTYPQLCSPVYPQLCSPGCFRFLGEDWARPSLKIWLVRQYPIIIVKHPSIIWPQGPVKRQNWARFIHSYAAHFILGYAAQNSKLPKFSQLWLWASHFIIYGIGDWFKIN